MNVCYLLCIQISDAPTHDSASISISVVPTLGKEFFIFDAFYIPQIKILPNTSYRVKSSPGVVDVGDIWVPHMTRHLFTYPIIIAMQNYWKYDI